MNFNKHDNDNFELSKHFVDVVLKGREPAIPLALEARHLRILFEVYKANT